MGVGAVISRMHQVQNAARVAMGDNAIVAHQPPAGRDIASIAGLWLVGGAAATLAAVVLLF